MNYKRIFGLKLSSFVTIDPSTFEVTNTFQYTDLKKLKTSEKEPTEFSFTCTKNGAMVWRTDFRPHLLTELVRLRAMKVDDSTLGLPQPFVAERIKRTGARNNCYIVVRPHAICETSTDGEIISEYRFLQITQLQLAEEDKTVLIVYVTGRARVWSIGGGLADGVQKREQLVVEMKKHAAMIGVVLQDGPTTSVKMVQDERSKLGSGTGVAICTYPVSKVTKRHLGRPVNRKLTITDEWLVERDASTFKVVNARHLTSVYALVRPQDEPRLFKVEFDDSASRTYQSNDRDMVLGSILDATHTAGNLRVCVTAEVSDGLRLTPRFFVEEIKKQGMFAEAFFGPGTIEGWHLKQLTKNACNLCEPKNPNQVLGTPGGTPLDDLINAAAEFNANVPVTGVDFNTDKDKVTKAVAPLLAILNAMASKADYASDVGELREVGGKTTILLQALLRLVLTSQGQKMLPKVEGVHDVFLRLLKSKEPFVAYWTVMVLSALIQCPQPGGVRNNKQEYENKQLLLAPLEVNETLVSLLNDNKSALLVKKRREGGFTETAEDAEAKAKEARGASSALSIMSVSGLLESVLCSFKDTTSPEQSDVLLNVISQHFNYLMSMLRSPCAIIMENACLIMMTIHEAAPQLAADLCDVATSESVLLRHFYLAIFSPSVDQRFVSRHLIGMWMSGSSSPQKVLLSKMVPAGLLEYLKMPTLSPAECDNLDFLEQDESEFAAYARADAAAGVSNQGKGGGAMSRLKSRIAADAADANIVNDENFRVMFHTITQDHKLPDLIWNQQTRREMRSALEAELASFDTAVRDMGAGNVAWNHQQFKIEYPSLDSEVRVGKTYLRTFLEGGDAFIRNYDEPVRFFDLLMRRVLVNFATKPELASMCAQCLERLYRIHAPKIGVFDDTHVLMELIGQATFRPVRHGLLLLVKELISRDDNTEQLLTEYAVSLLTDIASFGHTNAKSIGTKLQRKMQADYTSQHKLLTASTTSPTAAASAAPTPSPETASPSEGEGADEEFDDDDSMAPRTWYVAPGDSVVPPPNSAVQGPYRVSELKSMIADGTLSEDVLVASGISESYVDEDEAELRVDTGKWKPMAKVRQLQWQILSKDVLPVTPAEHGRVAVSILRRMVTMHVSVDHRGIPYHPIPFGKRVVSTAKPLAGFAQLILCNNPALVEEAAGLLVDILEYNPNAQAKLYLTGLFHFAMAYTGSNFGVVAKLMHVSHLMQHHRDSANAVASQLPLGKRSVLGESLPEAMLHILENYGPEKFAEVFVGTFDTPEVIWNPDMRAHLVMNVNQHIGDFPMQKKQNMTGEYNYCPIPTLLYPSLVKEVFCHNYYLRNLVDTARFPNWPIKEPIELFKAVLENWKLELSKQKEEGQSSINEACKVIGIEGDSFTESELRKKYRALARQYHPDRNPQGREMFEQIQHAYEVLTAALAESKARGNKSITIEVKEVGGTDDEKVLLMVLTQVMLCERFPEEVGEYKYPAYPLLTRVMKAAIPPAKGQPWSDLNGRLLVATSKLAYASCLISPLNAEELIAEGGILVMHNALVACLARVDSLTNPKGNHELAAIGWLAHSFSGLAHFESAREAMAPCCPEIGISIATLLTLPQSPQLAQFALEATARMAKHVDLQKNLIDAGVVWRSIPKLLHFDISLELQQKASIEAAAKKAAEDAAAGQTAADVAAATAASRRRAASKYKAMMDNANSEAGMGVEEAVDTAEFQNDEAAAQAAGTVPEGGDEEAAPAPAPEEMPDEAPAPEPETPSEAPASPAPTPASPTATAASNVSSSAASAAVAARAAELATAQSTNLEARLAARALGALAGQLMRSEISTEPHPLTQAALRYLLTPQLSKLLRNARPEELLTALNENTTASTKVWTPDMREQLIAFVEKVKRERVCGDRAVQSTEDELAPAFTFTFNRLAKELQVGGVYIKYFVLDPKASDIDHPDKFCDNLLTALSTYEPTPRAPNGGPPDPGSTNVLGCSSPDGTCTPSPGGGLVQDEASDCGQVSAALELLLLKEIGCRDVIVKAGPSVLLNMFESPIEGAPYKICLKVLGELASYRPFAQCVAKDQASVWKLLARLATAKDPICPPEAWAIADSLCATHDVVDGMLKSGAMLLMLAVLVGHADYSPALSGRRGVISIIQRCLRDPIGAQHVTAQLSMFFPPNIIDRIRGDTDHALTLETFDGESETPVLLWNASMRKTLRQGIADELKAYRSNGEPDGHLWEPAWDYKVVYPELEAELSIGGIYLRMFLKEPTFDLADPLSFLEQLLVQWFIDIDGQIADVKKLENKTEEDEDEPMTAAAESALAVRSAREETLGLITSAVVYLLKVRLPLTDQVATWGYVPRIVSLLKQSQDCGALGVPCVSALRLIHVIAERPTCIEALVSAPDQVLVQMLRLLKPKMTKDAAFVVEAFLRMFKFGKDSAHGYEVLVQAAIAVSLPTVILNDVLESDQLADVVDPAATKVHGVSLLKLLAADPSFGFQISSDLDNQEAWGKYKNQNHDLFLTQDQKVDYFLTDGNADAPQLLTWQGTVNEKASTAGLKRLAAAEEAATTAAVAESTTPAPAPPPIPEAPATKPTPPPVPAAPPATKPTPPPVPAAPPATKPTPPPVPASPPATKPTPPPVPAAPPATKPTPPPVPASPPATKPTPPPVPAAPAATEAAEKETLTIVMTKASGSLGVDLHDVAGRVVVRRLKEMPEGVAHPAKTAVPPLLVGDQVVSVNGNSYTGFKDCVLKIRASPETVTLVVQR
jgi:hypothetical protein